MTTDFNEKARGLRNAVEPVAAGVYFAPEVQAAYAALGFGGVPLPRTVARAEKGVRPSQCQTRLPSTEQATSPMQTTAVVQLPRAAAFVVV